MTWPEIRRTYPDQWVILGNLDRDEVTLEIHSAVVRGSGRSAREASARAVVDDRETVAVRYTGCIRSPRPW